MIKKIWDFTVENWKLLVKLVVGLFLLYWILFIFTPNIMVDADSRGKLDLLNESINRIESKQDSLQKKINGFNEEVKKIDDKIGEIKGQKTIIKEIYHEKIGAVSNYSDKQLDSFFSARYGGYYPR